MEEMKPMISDNKNIKLRSWIQFIVIALTVLLVSGLSSYFSVRLDLTEDKRYTLSGPSHEVLSCLKNDVYIQVYLDGDMPIAFKRLKRSVKELLDEFRIVSGGKVDYEFINPSAAKDIKARNNQYQSLDSKGLNRVNIRANDEEGGSSQKTIYPGMIVNYNGIEIPVNFLSNNRALSPEQNLLNSEEGLEYEMIQTISTLSSDTIYKVAFIEGHNELPEIEVADITRSLAKYFTVDRGVIGGKTGILKNYSAVIIAAPEKSFNEKDKLVIDQYIMNGGKVLWLYDEVKVNEDSLVYGETVALYRALNLEDQLFKYGVRINPSIIEDMECILIPITEGTGESQQVVSMPWPYYPLLIPSVNHPITRNLNRVLGKFVNYIDTVGRDPGIKKTVLLTTSRYTRIINPPALINLNEAVMTPDENQFNKSFLPVAVLLSGKFHSAFRNMIINDLVEDKNFRIKAESNETKMIIVADGDMIRNDVSRVGASETPLPLGQDRYTQQTFGNKDFLVNCLNYLVDDNGIMALRSRELKLRLLNKTAIKQNRSMIQLVNIAVPVLLVILAGLLYGIIRRKIYTKY
jgi:ABC-2 type transport system permease protein